MFWKDTTVSVLYVCAILDNVEVNTMLGACIITYTSVLDGRLQKRRVETAAATPWLERIHNKGSNTVQMFISTSHHTHDKYSAKSIITRRAHHEPDLTNDTEICVGLRRGTIPVWRHYNDDLISSDLIGQKFLND